MNFAKPALDVGLYTNNLEPMLTFWRDTVGLESTEMLPVGGGVRQHRHAIGDTILKVNHAREPMAPAAASGIRALTIATPERSAAELTDPDGNVVNLVAPGSGGVHQIEVTLAANDVSRSERFYADALGFEALGGGVLACGASRIRLQPGEVAADPAQRAPGYRYLTVQVYDVVAEHARALGAGADEGMAPVKLGDVAYISFIRDPDGNWIEISQRKSLVGSLD